MSQKSKAYGVFHNTTHSIITWEWTKKLLHWLIISAGTMSECVFLIASLWVSINANVHTFVLLFVTEDFTKHITELATTAYVALPECIVGLAVVVTLSHVRMWMYNKRDYRAVIWSILYGLPTVVFLLLSLITLGNAVASVDFQMPTGLVVIRALAGYMFAFTSLLYTQLGTPQEADRLSKKDDIIATLQRENEINLSGLRREKDTIISELRFKTDGIIAKLSQEKDLLLARIASQNVELENLNDLFVNAKNAKEQLQNALNRSDDMALQAYSEECINWLKSGVKSANVEEIMRFTGHTKRKIENAIEKKALQLVPRSKDKTLVLISSLVEWLKVTPPRGEQETGPMLHIVNR